MGLGSWIRRRPPGEREAAEHLKLRLRAHLGLAPEDALTVSEIACPACGPDAVETVVLVMRQGSRTVALKCAASMAELGRDEGLFAGLTSEPDLHRAPSSHTDR